MSLECKEIDLALKFAADAGNGIYETSEGWTNAKLVFHMRDKLSANLKNRIGKEIKRLEYWKDDGSLHSLPSEGFFCNECKVGITFPISSR